MNLGTLLKDNSTKTVQWKDLYSFYLSDCLSNSVPTLEEMNSIVNRHGKQTNFYLQIIFNKFAKHSNI